MAQGHNAPEIKVDYIGGNEKKREAIVSIGQVSYQVKEKSNPTDNVQVLGISDSSVTFEIGPPINATKTIDFKPE
ncbi:MAG: hypothetical protein HQL13_04805 [Candidatus Omnitrophica bacterium]|nr:hypothetical protein [Candidatus Omnitrophota bacterium]